MSNSAEAIAQAFIRAINRQDVESLAGLMTEDHKFTDALDNSLAGREAMRAAWAGYFRMVPDYTVAVEETLCDGPVVVLLGTAQGTYSADGKLSPENRWKTPIALRAFVEGDEVSEWRVYADNEPMRRLMAKSSPSSSA